MIACEEIVTEPEPIPIVTQPFLSFMYNGKEYNSEGNEINPWGRAMGTEREWLVTEHGSIWINRPDIFGGVISYGDANCTFLRPVHNDLDLFDCHLTDSAAVDSTAAYFYKSGTKSFAVHDCVTKRVFDYFFGKWYTDVTCIKKGTFDLELINNENKIIRITNGKWEFNIKK